MYKTERLPVKDCCQRFNKGLYKGAQLTYIHAAQLTKKLQKHKYEHYKT